MSVPGLSQRQLFREVTGEKVKGSLVGATWESDREEFGTSDNARPSTFRISKLTHPVEAAGEQRRAYQGERPTWLVLEARLNGQESERAAAERLAR